jgi:selT/selW/selH-like putative selenoprotein
MCGIAIFFLGNGIQANLLQSGAFEMSIDGKLVFSKLSTHRMPQMQEIVAILEAEGIYLQ